MIRFFVDSFLVSKSHEFCNQTLLPLSKRLLEYGIVNFSD